MKRILCLALALLCVLSACSGMQTAAESSADFFAMDTYMSIRAYGADKAAMEDAQRLVAELEAHLSATRKDSEIFRLNETGTAELSEQTAELLLRTLQMCERTGGALDVTVYPVVCAWGFPTREYRVPESAELAALLPRVDYTAVQLSQEGTAELPEGVQIDLGSVAKGYAGDCLCQLLSERGVRSALLDLGGNIQTLGSKPDGSAWRVGVRDPAGDGLLGVLSVRDEAVVTSGGYERYFTDNAGNLWWHIIDPASGYPAQNGLISVTVVGPCGFECDALSTALFILGRDGAEDWWRANGGFELALVTEDGALRLTPGLAERFSPDQNLPYRLEVIAE